MKKTFIFAVLLISSLLLSSGSSDCREARPFSVLLYLDRQKYHNSDDIMLHIQIRNTTNEEITFYIYDSPMRSDIFDKSRGDNADYTTFKPVVFDMNGKNAELVVPYIISENEGRETLSWMKKREIRLGGGESFMHTQNLRRIYRLEEGKSYRLKLHFFPFMGDEADENRVVLSGNELAFKIVSDRAYLAHEARTADDVKLSPSEVVLLLLNAEKENRWERSLKYIDLEKFIHSYPDYSRRYDLADDYDKKIIEKDFLRYLVARKSDYLTDFRIISEEIDNTGLVSYVTVDAARNSVIKIQRLRYVYRLEKKNEADYLWFVSGVEASIVRGGLK